MRTSLVFNLSKIFWVCLILAPLLSYAAANAAIGYSPALASAFLLLLSRFYYCCRPEEWLIFWLNTTFALSAFIYLIFGDTAGLNKFLVASFFVFFFASWSSSFSIHNDSGRFFGKLIIFYLSYELVVLLGQIMAIEYGVGLRASEVYPMMLTGTYGNANNLAAIVVCAFVCYSLISKQLHLLADFWVLICTALLLFFTASRASLALAFLWFCFLILRSNRLKHYSIALIGALAFFWVGSFFSGHVFGGAIFDRVFDRFGSFYIIMHDGLEADGSMSMRLDSYVHFFSNISNLGFGSANFGDYSEFYIQKYSDDNLMAKNPHSLVVELSYWMGFLGLFFFLVCSFWIFFLKGGKMVLSAPSILVFIVFLVSVHVPSSVVGLPLILLFSFISAEFLKGRRIE